MLFLSCSMARGIHRPTGTQRAASARIPRTRMRQILQTLRILLVLTVALAACACAPPANFLRLTPTKTPVQDLTTPSEPTDFSFHSVMILPPAGSERGQVGDSRLMLIEKMFLERGVDVISSGITARAVAGGPESEAVAFNLSDLERSLVLARKSNCTALLQLVSSATTRSAFATSLKSRAPSSKYRNRGPTFGRS